MSKILWKCSDRKLKDSNLFKFENFLKKKYKINYQNSFVKLWEWSINYPGEFWKSIWQYFNIKGQLGNENKLIHFSKVFYTFINCYFKLVEI